MNSIRRLPNSSSTINTSWAIRAKASQSTLYGIKVNNVWGEFRVHQCDNGILIDGGYYSEIEKGKFFNIAHTAIKQQNTSPWPWWNNNTPQINLSNNDIRNATIGIDLYNTGNTLSRIESNSIVNTPYREKSVAIRAQNIIGKITDCKGMRWLTIRHNESRRFKTGIQSDICNCLEISNNQIYLNNPNWDQAHGIWVRSSLGALIDDNNIYGSGTQWYSQGIRLEFSPQTTLSCNYVNNTENALWIHNNNNFSAIIGNTLMNYKYGLHLTYNGLIGSQLISGTVKYDLFNSFTNNGSYDNDLYTSLFTDGNNSPYCTFNINNLFSNFLYPSELTPVIEANNNSFSGYCRINNTSSNGPSFIFSGPYANENRWINKWKHKQFFKSMEDSLFQLFPNINYIYQLEDSIELTEINKFILADSLMVNKQWNDADLLLQQINSTELIEGYWKNTNQIILKYLPVFLLGNDTTVSLTDHISLLNIANSCPYQLGDIVTKARIFVTRHINPLEEFSDNCITGNNYMPRLSNSGDSLMTSIVYPNPGEDELYIKLKDVENVDIILYDLQGRIVVSEQNYQSGNLISTKYLKPGCYYIVLQNNEIYEVIPWIKK